MSSGHNWDDERCLNCKEKDWYADKYCSANPDLSEHREKWLEEVKLNQAGDRLVSYKQKATQ